MQAKGNGVARREMFICSKLSQNRPEVDVRTSVRIEKVKLVSEYPATSLNKNNNYCYMYLIQKVKKKLKKLKIVKLKKVQTKRFRLFAIIRVKNDRPHACIYILCNSRSEKFGCIRNNLLVQSGAELLDH